MEIKTKKCSKCGKIKIATEFYRDKQKKDGLMSSCKECDKNKCSMYRSTDNGRNKIYDAIKKYGNTENGKRVKAESRKKRNKKPEVRRKKYLKRVEQNKRIITEFKSTGCYVCGYDRTPEAIDCHHISSDSKTVNASRLLSHTKGKVIRELSLCVPLCSNCHRELHNGLFSLIK